MERTNVLAEIWGWSHKECLEERSLLVILWSAHRKPIDGWTSIGECYMIARVGRKLSWCVSLNSSPGLFFRHVFNLKPDNPLGAHGDWGRRDCPWQSTCPLSFLVSVNRVFLLLSASTHTNYSVLLPTGTAPRCRGHLKSRISQMAIKCLINL